MGKASKSSNHVINDFALSGASLHAAALSVAAMSDITPKTASVLQIAPALPLAQPRDFTPSDDFARASHSPWSQLLDTAHHYSLAVFAILFLAVGIATIKVGGDYWSDRIISRSKPSVASEAVKPTIAGLNLTVPANDLQAKLQTITNQPANLTVGTQTIPVGADTIQSWLQITASKDKSEDYVRIKAGSISASLTQLANQFVKTPVNQVTVSAGSVSQVVVAGRNGTTLSDPNTLKTQADQVAKTVMNGKGLQFNTPLATQPFQAWTPANFGKVLVADVTTKQMGAFQNGQQVNQWLVSAGAADTPTPIGEYHVYAKYAVQTMTGFNADGKTKYVQPNVPWVNYFNGGDAVHGNYWRPLSWFGNINSSHGCVSVPVDQAEWIYDWAPIGTTVITTDQPNLDFVNS